MVKSLAQSNHHFHWVSSTKQLEQRPASPPYTNRPKRQSLIIFDRPRSLQSNEMPVSETKEINKMNDGDSDIIVVNRDEEDVTKDCDIVECRLDSNDEKAQGEKEKEESDVEAKEYGKDSDIVEDIISLSRARERRGESDEGEDIARIVCKKYSYSVHEGGGKVSCAKQAPIFSADNALKKCDFLMFNTRKIMKMLTTIFLFI